MRCVQANPDRVWQLTADSTDDAAACVPMLLKARATAAKWTNPNLVDSDDDDSSAATAEEEEQVENKGEGCWFRKKAEGVGSDKQRYFMLCMGLHTHSLRFVYYAGLRDGLGVSRKGAIPLSARSGVTAHDCVLSIVRMAVLRA